ncbi:MAG: hypothetical protein QOD46_33, partial [Actinomycetota bacterium]|nr:hypothetical protein [Actinomycetota bacterium]
MCVPPLGIGARVTKLDTAPGAQHHEGDPPRCGKESLMASKDKGTKAAKKPAKQSLKEKR